jgi:hypothetical protein
MLITTGGSVAQAEADTINADLLEFLKKPKQAAA